MNIAIVGDGEMSLALREKLKNEFGGHVHNHSEDDLMDRMSYGFIEPNYIQFKKLMVGKRFAKKRTQLGLNGKRIMRKLRKIEDRKSDFIIQVTKSRNQLEIIHERKTEKLVNELNEDFEDTAYQNVFWFNDWAFETSEILDINQRIIVEGSYVPNQLLEKIKEDFPVALDFSISKLVIYPHPDEGAPKWCIYNLIQEDGNIIDLQGMDSPQDSLMGNLVYNIEHWFCFVGN